MFKQFIASLGIATMAAGAVATAQADSPRVSVLVGAGTYIYDGDRAVDDNSTGLVELGAGLVFDPTWTLEFIYSDIDDQDSDFAGVDLEGKSYRLDLLHHYEERGGWIPYAAGGIGHLDLEADGAASGDDKDTTLNLGGGVKRVLTDNLNLRLDGRAIYATEESDWDSAVTLGLTYVFGGASAPAPKPAPAPAAAPVDSDGDGVYDDADRCPNTPAGALVDQYGCQKVIKETVAIELEVLFDTNKSDVKPAFYDEINRVAEFMTLYPSTSAVIEGHTDSRGKAEYNKALSQRRADAVREVLIAQHKIAADRLTAVGYGEEQPRASNETREGQDQNRRVVAQIKTVVEKKATK